MSSQNGHVRAKTVADVLTWYAATSRPACAESERERLRIWKLFTDYIGEKDLDSCRPVDLLAFLDARQSLRSPWTRKRWLVTIQRPFNHAARLGLIQRNPFWGLQLPAGREGRDWTRKEYQAALRHSAPHFRRVIVFLRWSGARPGEMRRATVADVDFDAGVIVLWEHKTRRTSHGPRVIHLNAVVSRLLRWLVMHGDGPHLFVNRYGRPWTCKAVINHFALVRKRAGLGRDVKPHGLRHSWATNAITNGLDLATVAQLLGHRSVASSGRYIHLATKNGHLTRSAEKAVGLK